MGPGHPMLESGVVWLYKMRGQKGRSGQVPMAGHHKQGQVMDMSITGVGKKRSKEGMEVAWRFKKGHTDMSVCALGR